MALTEVEVHEGIDFSGEDGIAVFSAIHVTLYFAGNGEKVSIPVGPLRGTFRISSAPDLFLFDLDSLALLQRTVYRDGRINRLWTGAFWHQTEKALVRKILDPAESRTLFEN